MEAAAVAAAAGIGTGIGTGTGRDVGVLLEVLGDVTVELLACPRPVERAEGPEEPWRNVMSPTEEGP